MTDEKKDQDPKPEADASEVGSSRTSPPALQLPPRTCGPQHPLTKAVNGLHTCVDNLRYARPQGRGIFRDMSTDVPLLVAKAYRESLDSQLSILSRAAEHMRKLKTTALKKRAAMSVRIRTELETLLDKDPELISRISRSSSTVTETLDPLSPPTSPALSGSTAALSGTYPRLELLEIPTTPPKSTTTGVTPTPARPVKPTRLRRTVRPPSTSFQQRLENNGSMDTDLELMGSSSWTTSQGNGL